MWPLIVIGILLVVVVVLGVALLRTRLRAYRANFLRELESRPPSQLTSPGVDRVTSDAFLALTLQIGAPGNRPPPTDHFSVGYIFGYTSGCIQQQHLGQADASLAMAMVFVAYFGQTDGMRLMYQVHDAAPGTQLYFGHMRGGQEAMDSLRLKQLPSGLREHVSRL